MPRLTIADLGRAPADYRPSRVLENFETIAQSVAEDRRRARLLEKHWHDFSKKDRKVIKKLRNHLLTDPYDRYQRSCASSVDMRWWRNRWPGWLAYHVDNSDIIPVFVTLAPNTLLVPAGMLHTVDPGKLMQQFRNDLNNQGAKDADGGILLGLDCEYEPTSETYVFHGHGMKWGGMCDVVNRLRQQPKYAYNPNALEEASGAINPIRCEQVSDNLLAGITYIGKAFWSQRARTTLPNGKVVRARDKQRIKGRQHTEVLLWMHRQQIAKLFLTMKLRISRKGFKPWS